MKNTGKIWACYLVLIFSSAFLTGCPKEVKDKLLRTFFDGVPNSKESSAPPVIEVKSEDRGVSKKEPSANSKESTLSSHPPFVENQCDSCHDTKLSQKLTTEGIKLCFSCHDDFTQNKKVVHYPVSEGTCLECHDPHQAQNSFLLKKSIPQICFNCHDQKEIRLNPVHEDQNVCLDCHDPHVSNEEKLLR